MQALPTSSTATRCSTSPFGDHLGFGYVSTPPFIGVLAALVKTLFGYSQFGIKFFPALAGAGSLVLIALLVRDLGGKNLALILAGAGYLAAGAFLRSNSLFQPVAFNQFFWLLSAWLSLKLVLTKNTRLWLWIGAVFGLAFLNKYSIVFFAVSLTAALLLSRHRKLIFSRHFLGGMGIGFLVVLPNLIWQHQHNWPVIHHMDELYATQLVHVTTSGFLLDQLLQCAASAPIWIFGLFAVLLVPKEGLYRYLGMTFLLVQIALLLGSGKSYYTLGAFPMLYAAGGYAMEKYLPGRLRWVSYGILLLVTAFSLAVLPLGLPVASFETVKRYCDPETGIAPQRWEDGEVHPLPQDFADMTGWKELTALVTEGYGRLDPAGRARCTICGKLRTGRRHCLLRPCPRSARAISFHDSYLLWAPDSIPAGPFLYVNDGGRHGNLLRPSGGNRSGRKPRLPGKNGLTVWLCAGPREGWQDFYAQKGGRIKHLPLNPPAGTALGCSSPEQGCHNTPRMLHCSDNSGWQCRNRIVQDRRNNPSG
ncbi:MAG: glycosyltransferase family 39 protein [Bacteroidales bacterium]